MRICRWIMLVVLVCSAGIAAAQDITLDETYNFAGGDAFHYPSDWTLDDDPQYLIDIHSDLTQIYFTDFQGLQDEGLAEDSELVDAARHYFNGFYGGLKFQTSQVKDIEIGGREAIRYDFKTPAKEEAFILVIRFNDGTFGLLEAVSPERGFPEEDIVLAIAASFDFSGEARGATVSTPPVSCTVRTDYANAVHIRVGPGTNRTSFAFLPAEQDFDVLGQAIGSNGSVWFKLDKEAVAPGKSAAEAWIPAKDVVSTGNCKAVVDVNAPPLIPIVAAPPPSTGGGSTGGGVVTGGAVPSSGGWTLTYAAYAPGSCLNTGTVNLPIDFPQERYSLSISGDGSTMTIGVAIFRRTQPGVYQGLFSNPDGSSLLTTVRVVSPTLMSLEFIITFSDEGTMCSVTVNGTITHN